MCKGCNPNTLKLKIKEICGKIVRVWRSAKHTIQFCFGLGHFKRKITNLDFSWTIVTSLADIFTMESKIFKNIFKIFKEFSIQKYL